MSPRDSAERQVMPRQPQSDRPERRPATAIVSSKPANKPSQRRRRKPGQPDGYSLWTSQHRRCVRAETDERRLPERVIPPTPVSSTSPKATSAYEPDELSSVIGEFRAQRGDSQRQASARPTTRP